MLCHMEKKEFFFSIVHHYRFLMVKLRNFCVILGKTPTNSTKSNVLVLFSIKSFFLGVVPQHHIKLGSLKRCPHIFASKGLMVSRKFTLFCFQECFYAFRILFFSGFCFFPDFQSFSHFITIQAIFPPASNLIKIYVGMKISERKFIVAEAEDNPPVGETPGKSQRGLQDRNMVSMFKFMLNYSTYRYKLYSLLEFLKKWCSIAKHSVFFSKHSQYCNFLLVINIIILSFFSFIEFFRLKGNSHHEIFHISLPILITELNNIQFDAHPALKQNPVMIFNVKHPILFLFPSIKTVVNAVLFDFSIFSEGSMHVLVPPFFKATLFGCVNHWNFQHWFGCVAEPICGMQMGVTGQISKMQFFFFINFFVNNTIINFIIDFFPIYFSSHTLNSLKHNLFNYFSLNVINLPFLGFFFGTMNLTILFFTLKIVGRNIIIIKFKFDATPPNFCTTNWSCNPPRQTKLLVGRAYKKVRKICVPWYEACGQCCYSFSLLLENSPHNFGTSLCLRIQNLKKGVYLAIEGLPRSKILQFQQNPSNGKNSKMECVLRLPKKGSFASSEFSLPKKNGYSLIIIQNLPKNHDFLYRSIGDITPGPINKHLMTGDMRLLKLTQFSSLVSFLEGMLLHSFQYYSLIFNTNPLFSNCYIILDLISENRTRIKNYKIYVNLTIRNTSQHSKVGLVMLGLVMVWSPTLLRKEANPGSRPSITQYRTVQGRLCLQFANQSFKVNVIFSVSEQSKLAILATMLLRKLTLIFLLIHLEFNNLAWGTEFRKIRNPESKLYSSSFFLLDPCAHCFDMLHPLEGMEKSFPTFTKGKRITCTCYTNYKKYMWIHIRLNMSPLLGPLSFVQVLEIGVLASLRAHSTTAVFRGGVRYVMGTICSLRNARSFCEIMMHIVNACTVGAMIGINLLCMNDYVLQLTQRSVALFSFTLKTQITKTCNKPGDFKRTHPAKNNYSNCQSKTLSENLLQIKSAPFFIISRSESHSQEKARRTLVTLGLYIGVDMDHENQQKNRPTREKHRNPSANISNAVIPHIQSTARIQSGERKGTLNLPSSIRFRLKRIQLYLRVPVGREGYCRVQ
ncbi:hypothetical protein VP01_630g1 [Puccinia sorghi]|uniref:Uncharacterized protein n=1 Tax=Puccinia sorghi TaxID=27349 RepID=A0A0L6UG76_9BASI|nr:hypothetical protein VP01_630g1 [Puccinia sorghi]